MSNTKEDQATPMPSHESNSVSAERRTSSPYIRRTREEGRAMIAEYEEIGERFMQYLKANNMLPKPCPAAKQK